MAETLKARKDVPEELTWDLSLIYKTEEDMYADLQKMQDLCASMAADFKGKLTTPEAINSCLEQFKQVEELATLCSSYTNLAASVDYTDARLQGRDQKVSSVLAECFSSLSFVETEIAAQPEDVLQKAVELATDCKGYLKEILRGKPHQLHPEAERVLAAISHTTGLPYEAYETVKLADIQFEPFTVDGKTYPLGYSLFEDDYEYDPRTEVRRAAFNAFSQKISQYKNVTASLYNGYCQHEKIMAKLRGFENIYDGNLFEQKVDRALYDRQIDLITEKLAPHMRKFARLLKKIYKLDKMTFADLKLPVDPGYTPEVTVGDAEKYIKEGLAILGEDYGRMIETAFRERWVDFAQNIGKSTGGFCASPYGRGSFILLTWNGRMSDVFTLAHELGHAGHFKLCNAAQSIFDTNVSTYFVEAPSTMNELLMAHHMLKTSGDKRFRRWVLSNMVSNTYYHNFVTHLLEAAYQREVYKLVDAGGSVQADTLCGVMRDTLQKFWGDDVEIIDGAELTWMRQPHYYMGLYSYTYSAGLTVATQMCKRIENEGEQAIEDWKKVLTAGGTLAPVELAALAGIDITTDAPLLDTIETIGGYIDEICALTEELERAQ